MIDHSLRNQQHEITLEHSYQMWLLRQEIKAGRIKESEVPRILKELETIARESRYSA